MSDPKFHERFDIQVGADEARRRFVNRVYNFLVEDILVYRDRKYGLPDKDDLMRMIANELGERFVGPVHYTHQYLDKYLHAEFYRALQALEAIHKSGGTFFQKQIDEFMKEAFKQNEVELGVRWEDGKFLRTGAGLLDARLVNDPLHWLRATPLLSGVLAPFERGLSNLVQAGPNPNVLPDVVNAMYESLEAMAHLVTGRLKADLSANRELFLSKIEAPEAYKAILTEYTEYANDLVRHAREGAPKPKLSLPEVESFVYLTGLFLRMVIESTIKEKSSNRS